MGVRGDPLTPLKTFLSRFTLISIMVLKAGKNSEIRENSEDFDPCYSHTYFSFGTLLENPTLCGTDALTSGRKLLMSTFTLA